MNATGLTLLADKKPWTHPLNGSVVGRGSLVATGFGGCSKDRLGRPVVPVFGEKHVWPMTECSEASDLGVPTGSQPTLRSFERFATA